MSDKIDSLLSAALFRSECPSGQELNDYTLGFLDDEKHKQIVAHIGNCSHCASEIAGLTAFDSSETAVLEESGWVTGIGHRWQNLKEQGILLIALWENALSPLEPAPLTVKGQTEEAMPGILRRIVLGPDEVEDMDVEAIVRQDAAREDRCLVMIRVLIPSRWPKTSGIPVAVRAKDWQQAGFTDENGEIAFTDLQKADLSALVIDIQTNHSMEE